MICRGPKLQGKEVHFPMVSLTSETIVVRTRYIPWLEQPNYSQDLTATVARVSLRF